MENENLDPLSKFDEYSEKVHQKSNFHRAQILGLLASLLSAFIWAFISFLSHAQVGYIAIGLGLLVGGSIKYLCNPVGKSFAFLAAGYSFFGCLLGNLWMIGLFATEGAGLSFFELIINMDYLEAFKWHLSSFDGHDIAFYGLSIGAAFKLAYVRLKHDELDFLLEQKGIKINPEEMKLNLKYRKQKRQ